MRLPTKRYLPFKIANLIAILLIGAFGTHFFHAVRCWEDLEARWHTLCLIQERMPFLSQELPKATSSMMPLSPPQLLVHEIKKLESMERTPWQEKRLKYLTGTSNQLVFEERSLSSWIQKKQLHPVEMDEEDLKRWLTMVEGVGIWPYNNATSGHIRCIQECTLAKKILSSQEKVYEITMDVLEQP
jgi:hypothetical protein